MKYLLLILLLIPMTNAIAVTPTEVYDSFLIINNLEEKADYIIQSGAYEQTISLKPNQKQKINLTEQFSEEIYIYEIQEINGLGIINSVKIKTISEEQRLNLDSIKIAKPLSSLWLLLIVIPISGIFIYKKYNKKL
ncbi:MAG: hypothetical protein ABIJ18_00760 [archaeon]